MCSEGNLDLEVRHLRLIDAIVSEGGVTRAAGKLHLTQSALSHQLKEIEQRLSAPLFHRLKKRMVLTEAGERILQTARRVLEDLDHTEQEVRKIGKGEEGILRISTQCNTCYHWLPSMLKGFHQKYPGVETRIVVEATEDPIKALLEGKLDLAIGYKRVPDRSLAYFPLFDDELVAIVPRGHRLSSSSYVTAKDFADEALILYSIPLETNLVYQKFLHPHRINPRKIYHVMLTEAILEMVRADIGISVLARWAVSPYLKAGDLKAIRLTKKGVRREWFAALLKKETVPEYYYEFVRLLTKTAMPLGMNPS
jgi:LysR family transcriptional regulator for metE and metH